MDRAEGTTLLGGYSCERVIGQRLGTDATFAHRATALPSDQDSQNGFDNSGQALRVKWLAMASQVEGASNIFEHWPIRSADWSGPFDLASMSYPSTNHANLNMSLGVVAKIVHKYSSHPAGAH